MDELRQARAEVLAYRVFEAASPVLHIRGIGGKKWTRNVPKNDARHGPWLQADYGVLDRNRWLEAIPCLYIVAGKDDGVIRYAGISRQRMKTRWRESPAFDAETGAPIERQLFHSQCWKFVEQEHLLLGVSEYEVRCINGVELRSVLESLGPPISGFAVLGHDAEGIVASVERWMCNHKSQRLVRWNIAMTGRGRS